MSSGILSLSLNTFSNKTSITITSEDELWKHWRRVCISFMRLCTDWKSSGLFPIDDNEIANWAKCLVKNPDCQTTARKLLRFFGEPVHKHAFAIISNTKVTISEDISFWFRYSFHPLFSVANSMTISVGSFSRYSLRRGTAKVWPPFPDLLRSGPLLIDLSLPLPRLLPPPPLAAWLVSTPRALKFPPLWLPPRSPLGLSLLWGLPLLLCLWVLLSGVDAVPPLSHALSCGLFLFLPEDGPRDFKLEAPPEDSCPRLLWECGRCLDEFFDVVFGLAPSGSLFGCDAIPDLYHLRHNLLRISLDTKICNITYKIQIMSHS